MAVNTYPFKKYNYRVEIDSIDVAAFSEVSGFDASVDVIEYREGTDPINSPRKMPGLTKYGNVTLKWGMTENLQVHRPRLQRLLQRDRLRERGTRLRGDAPRPVTPCISRQYPRGRRAARARV